MEGDSDRLLDATVEACFEALAALGGRPPLGLLAFDSLARADLLGSGGAAEERASAPPPVARPLRPFPPSVKSPAHAASRGSTATRSRSSQSAECCANNPLDVQTRLREHLCKRPPACLFGLAI